ncbi:RNA-directed DNA polymerase from mobile element jockey [Caerostris darwini]|uniref:RNA-directed DNA polymerase from mobile element jockey n=1 Tax=Caerostris darwini TaxID=1538125 RepID=A0AAV4PPB8_9ARAC|nr:RNA-directed DNA polymerase from mobile element jockey [Caerostris darwini]
MYPGGTAIYIKNHIPHHNIPSPTLNTVQTTIVQLYNHNNPFTVQSQRKTPTDPNRNFFSLQDLTTLHNTFNSYFMGGDFKSHHRHWNCFRANTFGKHLFKFTTDNRLHIATPPTPTRLTPSTIDIALIKNLNYNCNADSISALTSDHNPVLFTFDHIIHTKTKLTYNIPNWVKFYTHLDNATYTPHNLNTPDGLESSFSHLTNIINSCYNATCKKILKTAKISHFSKEIRNKFTTRNHLRKIWQSTRHSSDKNNYTLLNNEIQQLVKHEKNKNWSNHLNSLSTSDNSLWNTIKSIRKQTHIIPPLKNNNSLSYSNIYKANILASHYEIQFTPNNIANIPTETLVNSTINSFPNIPNSLIQLLPDYDFTNIINKRRPRAILNN